MSDCTQIEFLVGKVCMMSELTINFRNLEQHRPKNARQKVQRLFSPLFVSQQTGSLLRWMAGSTPMAQLHSFVHRADGFPEKG